MSASKSTSMMRDFTSLPEFDLMFMFAVKSYLHSWCFQCSSRPRRMRGDMIEVFKIINDIYDPLTTVDMFELSTTSNTRGHSKKMKIKTSRLNVRKYTLSLELSKYGIASQNQLYCTYFLNI
jgi:hypothetical protein